MPLLPDFQHHRQIHQLLATIQIKIELAQMVLEKDRNHRIVHLPTTATAAVKGYKIKTQGGQHSAN